MNKKTKLLFTTIPAMVIAGLTGCKNNQKNNIFTICYYPGGYGTDWIEEYAKAAIAEQRGCSVDEVKKGVDYKLISDTNPARESNLRSKTSCPDLIFANGLPVSAISSGYVEPLSDVFNTTVQTSKGEKKIGDYLIQDCKEQFCIQRKYGQGERLPWAIPFTNIPISIAYNETLMKKVSHVDSYDCGTCIENGKWVNPPETVKQLKSYFADLTAYNPNLTKFGWCLSECNWFEPLYATWWAQYQGVNTAYTAHEGVTEEQGGYYDFWKYESPNVYKQAGIAKSFETVRDLLVDFDKHEFINSHKYCDSYSVKDMQTEFARGQMAMCLTGDFFEHEYNSILKNQTDVFKLMRIPAIEEAAPDTNKLTFVNTSSVLFIPSGAKNKDVAKKFLIESSKETNILKFLKDTGGIRSFDFDPELLNNYEFSTFQKSTLDLYFQRNDLLIKFPRNVADKTKINPIYIYEGIGDTLFSVVDYPSLLSAIRDYTNQEIIYDGAPKINGISKFKSLVQRAQEAFNSYFYD